MPPRGHRHNNSPPRGHRYALRQLGCHVDGGEGAEEEEVAVEGGKAPGRAQRAGTAVVVPGAGLVVETGCVVVVEALGFVQSRTLPYDI